MKQKILALLCALTLTVSLAGCTISTPDSVGQIGETEIPSGLYLLAQYDAYQQAAQLASDEQDTANAKSFLKQTITVDEESGETALVSDYVAEKTLENVQYYAAVEQRFDELGGELSVQQQTEADSYASQLYEQYGDAYKANGIGLETLERYEQISAKASSLLELVYGENGETPVSDEELTDYMQNECVYIYYTIVPLYNTSTYAFADDDQKAEMLSLAEDAVNSYNEAVPEGADAQAGMFQTAAVAALPDIYGVLDGTYEENGSDFSADLLTPGTLDSTFTENDSADVLRGLKTGEAAAVQYSQFALIIAVRLDPAETAGLDNLRSTLLTDMKADTLTEELQVCGADLDNKLDASAMAKLPASKIDAEQ